MNGQRRYIGSIHRYDQRLWNVLSDILHAPGFLLRNHKMLHVGLVWMHLVQVDDAKNKSVGDHIISSDVDVHVRVSPSGPFRVPNFVMQPLILYHNNRIPLTPESHFRSEPGRRQRLFHRKTSPGKGGLIPWTQRPDPYTL